MDVIKVAQNALEQIIAWRRDLHKIPELGLELPKTVDYVTQVLTSLGVEYDASYVNGNGIVAIIRGTKETDGVAKDRVLGMRADMDALPITEETGLTFASTHPGKMHACGHDGHTAMLLGVAKILSEATDQFSGTVKLIFQPGEEYPGGAEPMIQEGAMENPTITQMIGFHIGHLDPQTTTGQIGFRPGPMMASMDRFLIEIKGKGYHGAYPENSQDPIAAAGQLITALQTIKSRNIKAVDPSVVSITRVEGGFNQNVIPDNVELEGTVRAFDDNIRHQIHARMDQIAQGIGAAMGVECIVTFDYKYPAVVNDVAATREMVASLESIFEPNTMVELDEPLMGGEDYAYYLQKAPGSFFFLVNPADIEGQFHGHHHPKFDIDESQLYRGTAGFIKVALDYLND